MVPDLPPQPLFLAEAITTLSETVADRAEAAVLCARAEGHSIDRLAIFDANLPSTDRRFYLLDLTGEEPVLVLQDWVSHGAGSDPRRTGTPQQFSNTPNSHMTSLGLYSVAERYHGKNGFSWRLDGLTDDFNTQARSRAVVMHPARYVGPWQFGRSEGCPAVRQEVADRIHELGTDNLYLWIDGEGRGLEQSSSLACGQAQTWLAQRAERRMEIARIHYLADMWQWDDSVRSSMLVWA